MYQFTEGAGPYREEEEPCAAVEERLFTYGADSLSSPELVALIAGARNVSEVDALTRDGMRAFALSSRETLLKVPELERAGAIRLLASIELARRLQRGFPEERPLLATPDAIWRWIAPRVAPSRREEFHVLCFSARQILIHHARVAVGSVDQCYVDPREVMAPAVLARATSVALIHNHPSGDCEPSTHDIALTRQLQRAAQALSIRLLDHLVISEMGYVSMVERGQLY